MEWPTESQPRRRRHEVTAQHAAQLRRRPRRTILSNPAPPRNRLRILGQDFFATALLAHLEPVPDGGHTVRWSNAGHPPPTLIPPGATPVLLPEHDILLATPRHRTRDHTMHLRPGSILLLHTDGLIESNPAPPPSTPASPTCITSSTAAPMTAPHVSPTTSPPTPSYHAKDDIAFLMVHTATATAAPGS